MIEFKDILKQKSEDPSIDLHDFCETEMSEFIDTIKKRNCQSSALKKEVIAMDHGRTQRKARVRRNLREIVRRAIGSPKVTIEVKGLDPPVPEPEESAPIHIDDMEEESDYIQTNLRYEIEICWRDGAPHDVTHNISQIFRKAEAPFLVVPYKFAGSAYFVSADWDAGGVLKSVLLVSTGRCFEESDDIKLEESDRLHVLDRISEIFSVDPVNDDVVFYLRKKGDWIRIKGG